MTESRISSADDLIVAVEREQLGKIAIPPAQTQAEEKPLTDQEEQVSKEEQDDPQEGKDEQKDKQSARETEEKSTDEETDTSDKQALDDNVDEYGNTIAKKRLYTEEELNQKIRERLARVRQPDPVQPPVEQATEEGDTDDWRTQLHSEIKQVVAQEQQQKAQKEWEVKQQSEMNAYAEKFEQGSAKYSDFESVVGGKPITAPMMMATKAMQDPAAFIYAACKAQPAELERIARIPDQHVQIAEMAKLEERMKLPKGVTQAPKPARKISGDASSDMPKYSIDQLIASHAHEKIIKTRRLK